MDKVGGGVGQLCAGGNFCFVSGCTFFVVSIYFYLLYSILGSLDQIQNEASDTQIYFKRKYGTLL